MPKGVPKKGYRLRGPNKATIMKNEELSQIALSVIPEEPTEVIQKKLKTRFSVLKQMTNSVISGEVRSLIVSGPPGLGKSYTVEQALTKLDQKTYTIVKGYVKATGLFKLLWKHRSENHVIVFDDADSIFTDEVALNLLKTVTDTTETRVVSWLTEAEFNDDDGETLPSTFVFEGSIIFISNLDFDRQIEVGSKVAPHMAAMISRSYYIDLMMKTRKDYIVRIEQVINEGKMLSDLSMKHKNLILEYINKNKNNLRELSLRVAIKLGKIIKSHDNWEDLANITLLKPN